MEFILRKSVVQKENVCVIDNTTTFNDLIFDPAKWLQTR